MPHFWLLISFFSHLVLSPLSLFGKTAIKKNWQISLYRAVLSSAIINFNGKENVMLKGRLKTAQLCREKIDNFSWWCQKTPFLTSSLKISSEHQSPADRHTGGIQAPCLIWKEKEEEGWRWLTMSQPKVLSLGAVVVPIHHLMSE